MKLSFDKPGIPGSVDVYRYFDDGRKIAVKDFVASRGEPLDDLEDGGEAVKTGNVESLFYDLAAVNPTTGVFEGLRPIEHPSVIAKRAMEAIAAFPDSVTKLDAKPGVYSLELSPRIKKAQADFLALHKVPKYSNIGVFFGSFNLVHESHKLMVERYMAIYNLDKVIIVPASDAYLKEKFRESPGEKIYNADTRVRTLRRKFKDNLNIEISTLEVDGKTSKAYDTVQQIQSGSERGALLHIIAGSDLFETLPKWYRAHDLLETYNWIVSPRKKNDLLPFEAPLFADFQVLNGRLLENENTGRFIHMVEANAGTDSSTAQRAESDEVDTIFHEVDMGETFLEAYGDMAAGVMAVPGSAKIIPNTVRLKIASRDDPTVKSIASKDFHFLAEVQDPKRWNPEFLTFPMHGAATMTGPAGHQRLRALTDVFLHSNKMYVPHNREVILDDGTRALVPVLWDMSSFMDRIRDPNIETIIHKQGADFEDDGVTVKIPSYDFGINKHAEPIIKAVLGEPGMSKHGRKKRVVIYGVATDWCVLTAVRRYAVMGYEIWLATDAIAGIFPEANPAIPASLKNNIKDSMEEFKRLGVVFKTTDEVLKVYGNKADCKSSVAALQPEVATAL